MCARPAVFLDRDGTLNEPVGFINHCAAFRLFPFSAEAVRLINRSGLLAVLVTNQSGVARGLTSVELVEEIHARLQDTLSETGAHLDGIYYCPHDTSGGCSCRKPKPGMLLKAKEELAIDLERSWVVGDSYPDLEMASNAGVRAALVLTGYGRGCYENDRERWSRQPDLVAPNVLSAVVDIVWEVKK